MNATIAILLSCSALFVTSALWAGPPGRFGHIEAAGEALKAGQEVPATTWEDIRRESYAAMGDPDVMGRIDLPGIARASALIFTRDAMLDLSTAANADAYIVAQRYVALLLARGATLQAGSGSTYRSAPDEVILKPLLVLANNWLAASDILKSKGADASAPNYSGTVNSVGTLPLSDETKARIAEHERKRALIPLNSRLGELVYNLRDLSKEVKLSIDRLKTAGEAKLIEEAITASGITQERLRQLNALP